MQQYLKKVKKRIQEQWIKYVFILIILAIAMLRNYTNQKVSNEEPVKLTEEQISKTAQYKQDTIIQYGIMSAIFIGILAFVQALNNKHDKPKDQEKEKVKGQ
ncbi:unnamed protein product [Paramecium sonneborni]|uniref:Uncharacterized protein n=1 Tax=Paramecium sonneborni TaxID=65129 RepID=A0A8S1KPH9_9CILI|nr:unnamed protein product [Paramecium sonneborni]